MDDLIKSLDNLCAAIENLAEAAVENKKDQATAASVKKAVSGQLLEIMASAANAANDSDHDIAPDVAPELGYGMGITQADLQLIFIKNLSATLIQRMYSMDRFSDDDYTICGDKLMPWDIIFSGNLNAFGLITSDLKDISCFEMIFFRQANTGSCYSTPSNAYRNIRTINQDELKDFRAMLEACYAN